VSQTGQPAKGIEWTYAFLAVSVALAAVAGVGWIRQSPSAEELYGDTGRFIREFGKLFLGGNIEWWSSDFLGGHSAAPYLMFSFPSLIGVVACGIFGDLVGLKIILLACLLLSAGGVYLFTYSLTEDRRTAFLGGILTLGSAQILLRVADFEHYNSVVCVTMMPYALWAWIRLEKTKHYGVPLLLGAIWSLIFLSYAKLAITFVPLSMIFYAWAFVRFREARKRFLLGAGVAGLVVAFCAIPFLLPLIREYQWMSLFPEEQLSLWQKSFSMKNIISAFDRGGILLSGMPETFRADRGQFYLGFLAVISFGIIFKQKLFDGFQTKEGAGFRISIVMILAGVWLSHGPYSPVTGLFEFLRNSGTAGHWLPGLVWMVTAIPGIIIFSIFPEGKRRLLGAGIFTWIYYFVPGFALLEKLPLFRDIRAPWVFWEVSYFMVPVAAAIALNYLFQHFFRGKMVVLLTMGAVILSLLDGSTYARKFFTEGLPRQLFEDFGKAGTQIRESGVEGRVYSVSGRYFDLRTPLESGRGLCSDAVWNHFQLKPYSSLFRAAHTTAGNLASYFSVAGISHLLLDKKSPFLPSNLAQISDLTSRPLFDSEYISVREIPKSLAPGFLAKNYIAIDTPEPSLLSIGLEIAGWLPAVMLELPEENRIYPYLVSSIAENKMLSVNVDNATEFPFQRLGYAQPRNRPSQMILEEASSLGQEGGWMVVTEAWHPDWTATSKHGRLDIRRAFGGIMAVRVGGDDGEVHFSFQPPSWYGVAVGGGVVGWIALLSLGAFLMISAQRESTQPKKDKKKTPSLAKKHGKAGRRRV
jgi:hypothetical protein